MKSPTVLLKPGRYTSTLTATFTLVEVKSETFKSGYLMLAFNTELWQEIVTSKGGVIIVWEANRPKIIWLDGNGKLPLSSPLVYLIEVIPQNLSIGGGV